MEKLTIAILLMIISLSPSAQDIAIRASDSKPAKVTMLGNDRYPYANIGWEGNYKCIGNQLAFWTAHELSNLKDTTGDGVPDSRYAHEHMSAYVVNSECKPEGRIDIPFGYDHTQVQIEKADLVMKGVNSSIIIRSGNAFCKISFIESNDVDIDVDGIQNALTCTRIPSYYIIQSNKKPSDSGYPPELDHN